MDPATHGLVGATTALLAVRREGKERLAVIGAGALAAMAPDLDVLLQRASDPLFQLEYHRQFSHCLLLVPVGALLVAAALWWLARRWLTFRDLYLSCFAGTATAGLLDACTSYGTQLLWPFSSARIAWNLTPVVEPLFTIVLLILLGTAAVTGRRLPAILAGSWIIVFLVHGAFQQKRALQAVQSLHHSRDHQPEDVVVKPTLGNQILWRVNYIAGGRLYSDAVRTGLVSVPEVYPGESAPLLSLENDFAQWKGTRAYQDIQRFATLSQGYLIRHPEHPNVIGDGRYAMLPTSLKPLWGLEIDPAQPEAAPRFLTFRDSGPAVRQEYWAMLRGQARPPGPDAP